MKERALTNREKDVLKKIVLPADSTSLPGLIIWYNPELPEEHAACYLGGLPSPNKTWENEIRCTKEQLDGIRAFADWLESEGALQRMNTKHNEEYYFVYKPLYPDFNSVYKRIDPEGYEAALQAKKSKKGSTDES